MEALNQRLGRVDDECVVLLVDGMQDAFARLFVLLKMLLSAKAEFLLPFIFVQSC